MGGAGNFNQVFQKSFVKILGSFEFFLKNFHNVLKFIEKFKLIGKFPHLPGNHLIFILKYCVFCIRTWRWIYLIFGKIHRMVLICLVFPINWFSCGRCLKVPELMESSNNLIFKFLKFIWNLGRTTSGSSCHLILISINKTRVSVLIN